MVRKTRKRKTVEHHHFLLRMETRKCPKKGDEEKIKTLITKIIHEIHMKSLGGPFIYYVNHPVYKSGMTAINPIETSHLAFHFWNSPEKHILHNSNSKCLLQFDIYTCGPLTKHNIYNILHNLSVFEPTHINATLINRKYGMTIDQQIKWDKHQEPWSEWLEKTYRG